MQQLGQRFHQLRKIVLALSGANEEVLALVPSEQARYESLGWAILITSGVAAVSMWFALASAVGINGILAFPVALAWGLVIMGIDRWLVVSMPTESKRKFAIAVPRLALALLLGTLISTPLVLRVFQSEVNAEIAKMQQQNYSTFLEQQKASDVAKQVGTFSSELQYLNNVIATHGATTANTASDPELRGYNTQLNNLDNEVAHWTSLKNKYYVDYICQLYGGPNCPKKGNGPAAKASLKNYQDASQEVDTLKGQVNQVQAKIQQRDAQLTSTSKASQEARYQQALTQLPVVKNEYSTALQRQNELQASFFATNKAAHGILVRLEALSKLSSGNFTVTAARFLLFLLFLTIECLPVTVKLLQRPGLYEEALEHAREAERKDFSKFFSFRSRLVRPNGTAFMRPTLLMEPDHRISAIWTPTRALPGAADVEDDQPTEAVDEGREPFWEPRGRSDYQPVPDPDDTDRPGRNWYGPDSWRNHWYDQPADDDEPRPGKASEDADDDPSGSGPAPSDLATRVDYGAAIAAPPAGGGWPGQDQATEEPYVGPASWDEVHQDEEEHGSMYGSDGYRVLEYRDESPQDQGSRAIAWRDDGNDEPSGSRAPASAGRPSTGGTQLSWDEDE